MRSVIERESHQSGWCWGSRWGPWCGLLSRSVVVSAVEGSAVARLPLALDDLDVGLAEGLVAQGVAEGVDGRVDVAEEVEEVPHALTDAVLARCQRLQQHQHVVRQPRDDEHGQDCGQRLGRLFVRLLLARLFLLLLDGKVGLDQLLGDYLGVEGNAHVRRVTSQRNVWIPCVQRRKHFD
jgi:hypothetical protein